MTLAPMLAPPEMPPGLRLIGRIGKGAAGDLFRVADITGKEFALKIVRAGWRDRELGSVKLFRQLPAHPALAQVLQAGELADGHFFYTMELADNAAEDGYRPDTLADRLRTRPPALPELLKIMDAAAEGASHLHEHGLFHGDIKPDNLIFVNGNLKLADFGTLSGGDSGTAGFLPDDPVSGIDRDCYALGKTLYCAWSGLDAAEFPAPPKRYDDREFKIVRKIYMRACADTARKRFASAADFRPALACAAAPRRGPRRTRILTLAAAVLTVLALTVLFVFRCALFPAKQPIGAIILPNKPLLTVEDIDRERREEADRRLAEHADEIAEMKRCGIEIADDPRYGVEYRDTGNGFRGVGLSGLLEYWEAKKRGVPYRPRASRTWTGSGRTKGLSGNIPK